MEEGGVERETEREREEREEEGGKERKAKKKKKKKWKRGRGTPFCRAEQPWAASVGFPRPSPARSKEIIHTKK